MSAPPSGEAPPDPPLGFIPSPTPQLRAFVAEQQAALPAAELAHLLEQVRRLYEKYSAALAAAPAGVERARALHRMMDGAVATAAGVAVSCRYGCSGCCHCEVEITTDEAAVLRERVEGGMEVDRDRLARQADRPRRSPAWAEFWSPDNRCVFLNAAGVCRIYEDRPAVCRRLLVTTPPEACTTAGAPVAPVRILLAEILLSAAISLESGAFASLARRLQAALG